MTIMMTMLISADNYDDRKMLVTIMKYEIQDGIQDWNNNLSWFPPKDSEVEPKSINRDNFADWKLPFNLMVMMIDDNDDDYDGDDSDHSMDDMIEGTYSRTKRTSHWETRAGVFQPSLVFSPCSPVKMMMVVNGGDDEDDDDDDDG